MKQYIFMALVMVCAGCGGESLTSGPSPLETFDQDRLWVLIRAVGVGSGGDGCARYYRDPDNPQWKTIRRGDLSKVCPEVMVKIATYLAHNGVAGVEPAHLQKPDFWDLMQAKYEAIKECEKQLGGDIFAPPPDPTKPEQRDFPDYKAYGAAEEEYKKRLVVRFDEHKRAWRACDPYLVAAGTKVLNLDLADFGISLPVGMSFD